MNPEVKESLVRLLRPLIFAFVLIALGGWLFSIDIPTGEGSTNAEKMKALGYAFGGFLLIGAGAAVLLFPLAHVVSAYFESLFWPSDLGTAPALHKLPEWYIQEGRYADALMEYEKMLRNHPRHLEAYQGLLYVTLGCMGNSSAAEKHYRKALRKVLPAQGDSLKAYYEDLRQNRATAPNHSQKESWEK